MKLSKVPSQFIIDKLESGNFKDLFTVKIHTDKIGLELLSDTAKEFDKQREIQRLEDEIIRLQERIEQLKNNNDKGEI